uniref:E3 UFM1-protein ligase 1 homolog n=1 Tax=Syphacia muris TaxID=451379 RepID=A0A0N5ABY3_9BILA
MPTTWADIQRLAADLQRVQLTEGSKRISEKNCVEIMSRLLATKAVDIVFTTDGRAYVTKKHLMTEIKNECLGNDGRISLSDLSRALNIDYEHIENAVKVILKQSDSFELFNAELISKKYVENISDEVNKKLSKLGVLSTSQLAKTWDLPTDVLNDLVLNEVGIKINAFRDDDKIYTIEYLEFQKNLLRAVVNSLTR